MARPRMQRLLYAVREEGMTRNVVDKLFYRVGHPIRLNALKKIVSYLEMKVLLKSLNESED